jgi:hypothetical protein
MESFLFVNFQLPSSGQQHHGKQYQNQRGIRPKRRMVSEKTLGIKKILDGSSLGGSIR